MGDWHGTGYIVTNPETGAGAYMISGGLNGGSTAFVIDFSYMLGMMLTAYLLTSAICGLTAGISALCYGIAFGMMASAIMGLLGLVLSVGLIIYACNLLVKWEVLYYDYLLTGNIDEGLYMSADIANEIIDLCKVTMFWGTICVAASFAGIEWKINYEDSNFIKEFTEELFTEALTKVKEMVLEAFRGRSFYRTSRGELYINGTSANGVKFEGWIDLNTNKLKSFYPVSKFQNDY